MKNWFVQTFLSRIAHSFPVGTYLRSMTTILGGRRLLLLRLVWIGVALLTAFHFIASLLTVQNICPGSGCLLSPNTLQVLQESGISANTIIIYFLVLTVIVSSVFLLVGTLIFWRAAQEPMALYTAFTFVAFGGTVLSRTDNFVLFVPAWTWIVTDLTFLGQVGFTLFFYLFPDVSFVPRWTCWLAGAAIIVLGCLYFFPDTLVSRWLFPTISGWAAFFLVSGIFAQMYRYRRMAYTVQRQQTRWVVFGFTLAIIIYIFYEAISFLLFHFHIHSAPILLIGETLISLSLANIPLSIGIAILRYRLWQIDRLINRTLVYGLLTASVLAIYVLVVGAFAIVSQASNNLFISLIATGLVAVLVQPLRTSLQRSVNRLMYGERDDPYTVLSRLGQRLDATLVPDAMLQTSVETIAQSLKLPYAAILLLEAGTSEIAASYGVIKEGEDASLLRLPLMAHMEQVGEMVLAPRLAQETFTEADQKLLRELARRAELAVHSARLTADLQHLTLDLQRSREHLVLAREEERRRIRRDLHDGLAPTLAALALSASTIGELIPVNPAVATRMANELEQEIRTAISDIRRLVYDLRPPTLDQLGLIAAIQEYVVQQVRPVTVDKQAGGQDTQLQLQVTIQTPESLPLLPAAIEVAIYRIVQEGLMNVIKHAHARTCFIRLSLSDTLQVEIVDDGVGLPTELSPGVGLISMGERAAELGGACTIGNNAEAGTGTRVLAQLPILKEE